MKTATFYTTVIKALKQLKKNTASPARLKRISQYLRDFKEIDAVAPTRQKQNFGSKAYQTHFFARQLSLFADLNGANVTEQNVTDYLYYKLINNGYGYASTTRLAEAGLSFETAEFRFVAQNA